jgi:gliding motility-associated protein GldL
MSNKKGGVNDLLYKTIMPKIYGIGASVVILGAMFKILHLPGAGAMLGVGLTTEAIIFFFSAFEPPQIDPDWSKVYPELSEDIEGTAPHSRRIGKSGDQISQKLDHMLEQAKIGPELVESLGRGMHRLSENVGKMNNMGDVGAITKDYADSLRHSTGVMNEVNKSYDTTLKAMQEMASVSKSATADMANSSQNAKEYHTQVQSVTRNLEALNAVYELELQDANSHVKAMNKFYSNLTTSLESMSQATEDAEQFKSEIKRLTSNLASLNTVYGNMLTAMKS